MVRYALVIRVILFAGVLSLQWMGTSLGQSATSGSLQDRALRVADFNKMADDARNAGRYDEESAILIATNRAFPDDVHVLWRLTRSAVEAGELADSRDTRRRRFFEAMQYGKMAVRADSTHHLGYIWLAISEAAVASVEGIKTKVRLSWNIRQHAEKAISLNPDFDSGYHILARWHYEVAGIGGVKRALARAFVGELPEASYDESIRLYRQAIAINDLIHHRLALVQTYIRAGRVEEARRELNVIVDRPSEKRLDDKHIEEARKLLASLD